MVLHDQKYHIVPHFHHLVIRNVMVVLPMPSSSCYADAVANGVTSLKPKSHVALHFDHHDLRSTKVPLTMLFAPYDADASANGSI